MQYIINAGRGQDRTNAIVTACNSLETLRVALVAAKAAAPVDAAGIQTIIDSVVAIDAALDLQIKVDVHDDQIFIPSAALGAVGR